MMSDRRDNYTTSFSQKLQKPLLQVPPEVITDEVPEDLPPAAVEADVAQEVPEDIPGRHNDNFPQC